jgi:hypothetical protein
VGVHAPDRSIIPQGGRNPRLLAFLARYDDCDTDLAMRSRGTVLKAALAALAFSCGCSSHPTGVLGNGEFRYLCGSDIDTACSAGDTDTDLPGAIAVGSTFQIAYRPNSSTGTVQGDTGYEIVAASPRLASTSADTIAALRQGYVALLARHVGNATIDDFVHLHFDVIRTLNANPSSVTVAAGGQESIAVEAHDALSAPLAGRLSCQWSVAAGGPSIALVGSKAGSSAAVMASAQGGVTAGIVHIVCGAASVDVPVTVTGVVPSDAGAPLDGGGPVDAARAPDGGPLG